ncbi:tetratricopeptide repeat protein 23-like [Emydura macquarii macquarii]|uniref:tetratricopeptide repeat protein 23-like n=1 Tax=Emydura macquarii macquarii TaxID=1129001 RepID=UPI00352A9F86
MMQDNLIYIPTDSSYGAVESHLSLETSTTASEHLDESNNESTAGDSEGEEKKARKKVLPMNCVLAPNEKLEHALKMAEKFIKEKEVYKANRELIRCVALTRIIYGDGHWQLGQAFANLAYSYLILRGLPAQAIEHAESAKHIMLTGICTPPATPEDKRERLGTLVTIYYTLGVAHLIQNNDKESYLSLQKAERHMEELQELDGREIVGLKISQKDLVIALGRTCLQQNKLGSATGYFEKAVDAVISAEGDMAPELINLYQKIAQSEQLKKNHERAIRYLLQAHSICVALHKKCSVEAAQTGLLLGKAYAATGEQQHIEAAETYFTESLTAYQAVLGAEDSLTLTAVEEFSKWLVHVGKKQKAYRLLKDSLKSIIDTYGDFSEKAAETYHIMGSICLAEGKMREAYQLFNKCLQIQIAVYGPHNRKPKEMQELLTVLERSPAIHEGNRLVK